MYVFGSSTAPGKGKIGSAESASGCIRGSAAESSSDSLTRTSPGENLSRIQNAVWIQLCLERALQRDHRSCLFELDELALREPDPMFTRYGPSQFDCRHHDISDGLMRPSF